MRFLSWRPLHGWRAFWGEVGIVVLGILLALGAQQVATEWDGKGRARAALKAVDAEMATNAGTFEERTLQQPCIERRLDELSAILRGARRTGSLPLVEGIGKSIGRPTLEAAWEDAQGTEVLGRWSEKDRHSLAIIYSQQAPSDALTVEEASLWLQLQRMMSTMAGPVAPSDLTALIALTGEIDALTWNNAIDARQLLDQARRRKLTPDYSMIFDRPGTRDEMLAGVAKSRICQPLKLDAAAR